MPIQSKTKPAKITAGEWQTPGRGLLEGKGLNTGISLLRYATDVVGEGPTLHVHPYDEISTITEGHPRHHLNTLAHVFAESALASLSVPRSQELQIHR